MTNMASVASKKSNGVRKLIMDALDVLSAAGVRLDDLTARRLEKMAMSFLAVANMKPGKPWADVARPKDQHILRTREIISYINEHFEESISSGSYDDIRRKDLLRPVGMALVIKSANNENADTNDGTRGYAISEALSDLAASYGSDSWEQVSSAFVVDQDYIDQLEGRRTQKKLPVSLPGGQQIQLDDGPHNQIQKAVVDEFLPRFGYGAEVYYIGDTSDKKAVKSDEELGALGLNVADRGMLPDIIAFSRNQGWLYLIEAVHSSNPLNPERCIELSRTLLRDCRYGVVYVTAFLTKRDFIKWAAQIAWETEVWIADNPDHMIHFNGDKFLGPHKETPS